MDRLAENQVAGDFNATGPTQRMSISSMLDQIGTITESSYSLTWIPEGFLQLLDISPWSDLPTWIPGDPLSFINIDRALASGLSFRSLAQTALDTLDWDKTRPEEQRQNRRFGMSRERERDVLNAWRNLQR